MIFSEDSLSEDSHYSTVLSIYLHFLQSVYACSAFCLVDGLNVLE